MARQNVDGKVVALRVNEMGLKYGPRDAGLEAEVLFRLDSHEDTYGFRLRGGNEGGAQNGMFLLLKEARSRGLKVYVGYEEHPHAHRCYRVALGGSL